MPTTYSPGVLAAVTVGSGLGGVARYLLTLAAQPKSVAFPIGTLTVNVLGCLLIGGLAEFALTTGRLSPEARVLLISGFCGGFTTFSTFSFESLELIQAGAWPRALLYAAISVCAGLVAVWMGAVAVKAALGVSS